VAGGRQRPTVNFIDGQIENSATYWDYATIYKYCTYNSDVYLPRQRSILYKKYIISKQNGWLIMDGIFLFVYIVHTISLQTKLKNVILSFFFLQKQKRLHQLCDQSKTRQTIINAQIWLMFLNGSSVTKLIITENSPRYYRTRLWFRRFPKCSAPSNLPLPGPAEVVCIVFLHNSKQGRVAISLSGKVNSLIFKQNYR